MSGTDRDQGKSGSLDSLSFYRANPVRDEGVAGSNPATPTSVFKALRHFPIPPKNLLQCFRNETMYPPMRTRRDARFILWCCVFWAVVMLAALPLGKLAQMIGWL